MGVALALVALVAAVALLLVLWRAGHRIPPGTSSIHVSPGLRVEKIAGPELSAYPMLGTFDDRGRLFVCESSGFSKVTNQQMAANPTFIVRMLVDVNGDGYFDRSTVFADRLTLPAGAEWYRGALYVASPPDLLRFEDRDDDGIAERREVIATGWNLSSNAASLHGPFMGPDGWLYLTDGRHGFKIKTQEGAVLEGRASRIWRLRPDGSGLEWFAGGGFDNPVEVVFTPAGEVIGTMTYFTDPKNGERDALLHFVEGGVYPKWHPYAAEFKRTGELMPVMTKFARIAPSGLLRYRGVALGTGYDGSLFSAHFNSHRVQRHKLIRDGATFRTEDTDFLTSSDPDFHPTDVLEDADGSLVVIDTGAWFIHGCPLSQISKPDVKGGIYRIRRIDPAPVRDPRGLAMQWNVVAATLAERLKDPRLAVRDRAVEALVAATEAAVPVLHGVREGRDSAEVRALAVFALARIGSIAAREAVRAALADAALEVRIAAARMCGMAKDPEAVDALMRMAQQDEPAARRQAATALGQIGDRRAVPALLAAAASAPDRFVEHSVIYSLLTLADAAGTRAGLAMPQPLSRKAALVALDQMDPSSLRRGEAAVFLRAPEPELRAAALWVFAHRPEWSDVVLEFLRARMRDLPPAEEEKVREVLIAFCADSAVQKLIGESLDQTARRPLVIEAMSRCSVKALPPQWIERLRGLLAGGDTAARLRVIQLLRSRGVTAADADLARLASAERESADVRVAALGTIVQRRKQLDAGAFAFLLATLAPAHDAALRLAAAQVLGRADLSREQMLELASKVLPGADPLIVQPLVEKLRASSDAGVQSALKPLLARAETGQKERVERLRRLEPLLTGGGDVGNGRRVFFGSKVGCSKCHTIGSEGSDVGPDLTAVGAIRSGHDLLEAIVFPSASFVPGFEVHRVETADGVYSGRVLQRTPDAVVLLAGPGDTVRIPRAAVQKMAPSPVSLMPDNLDRNLSETEFRDLLAFLQSQKSREDAR